MDPAQAKPLAQSTAVDFCMTKMGVEGCEQRAGVEKTEALNLVNRINSKELPVRFTQETFQ